MPVLSVAEMAAVDAAAPEPVEELIERAGGAVAWAALRMLGGAYGKRVVRRCRQGQQRRRRARTRRVVSPNAACACSVFDATDTPSRAAAVRPRHRRRLRHRLPRRLRRARSRNGARCWRSTFRRASTATAGSRARARSSRPQTVTMGALKPGLLLADGPDHAGEVIVETIGLDDVDAIGCSWSKRATFPPGCRAGRATRTNGAAPCVSSVARPVSTARPGSPPVRPSAPVRAWFDSPSPEALRRVRPSRSPPSAPTCRCVTGPRRRSKLTDRCAAAIIGPGLGRSRDALDNAAEFVANTTIPLVVDADGLDLTVIRREVIEGREAPVVITPHDAEFDRLSGRYPGEDRIGDVVALAEATGCVVLLKGPTTIVADSSGRVLVTDAGRPAPGHGRHGRRACLASSRRFVRAAFPPSRLPPPPRTCTAPPVASARSTDSWPTTCSACCPGR